MKRRSEKIGKVVAVASSEERQSGQKTGRLHQRLDEQLARLGELHAFRHNYSRREVAGITAMHLKDYQTFLSRLDTAVQTQQQVIRDCEQNLAIQRERWMQKRQKLDALERVLEKTRSKEAEYLARQEQKRLDEMAQLRKPLDQEE